MQVALSALKRELDWANTSAIRYARCIIKENNPTAPMLVPGLSGNNLARTGLAGLPSEPISALPPTGRADPRPTQLLFLVTVSLLSLSLLHPPSSSRPSVLIRVFFFFLSSLSHFLFHLHSFLSSASRLLRLLVQFLPHQRPYRSPDRETNRNAKKPQSQIN